MVGAEVFTVVEGDSMVVEEGSTAAVEDFTGAAVDSMAGLPAEGATLTAAVFVADLRRAWAARTGDPAGTRLVRMAILPSAAERDPARMA